MHIERIRHQWTEKAGFVLLRSEGAKEYVLLHFHTPVEMSYGGRTHRVSPGTVIVFSPGTPHRVDCPTPLLHDWIHLSGNIAEIMARYGLRPDTLYPGMSISKISDLIADLEMEYFARRPYWNEFACARLNELLIRISHRVAGEHIAVRIQTETLERLRDARAHMINHPERAWSIATLAAEVGVSPSRLHALYKSSFGVSPNRDLILMRIEKAKDLLQHGRSVSETAEGLGYSSAYHFIRQFKQIMGVSPGRFHRHRDCE